MPDVLSFIDSLFKILALSKLGFNGLDLIVIIVFVFYALEGFEVGFVASFFDLLSFILSFLVGLTLYSFVSSFLADAFFLPHGFANAAGFFILAFISEIVFTILLRKLLHYLTSHFPYQKLWSLGKPNTSYAFLLTANRFLGFLPGIASAFILLSFVLTVVISLPFSSSLKHTVSSSKLGDLLVSKAQGFETSLNEVFGGAINDTLTFLTVAPKSGEFVQLKFVTENVSIDEQAEKDMFGMVNRERMSQGLSPLAFDAALTQVARQHSEDMFRRGYFSHYTPEGLSPFDRMSQANISFSFAGENLALAPSATLAMQGLMQSTGHRANILNPNFKKVGIGVIDGGIYGEMFTQEFTD